MSSKSVNILQSVNQIRKTIVNKQLIKRNEHTVISISAGQDSSCLLLIIYLLRSQIGFHFGLVWYNHLWQKSSFFTMLHIAKTSFSFCSQICFFIPLDEVVSELSSRDWRFNATQRTCLFYHYHLCMQGHSKSDRIETVLFNLIRGSGIRGISTLQWERKQSFSSLNKFYPCLSNFLQETHTRLIPSSVLLQLLLANNMVKLSQYRREYKKGRIVPILNSSQSSCLNYIQEATLKEFGLNAVNVLKTFSKDFLKLNTPIPFSSRIKANTSFHETWWYYQLKDITLSSSSRSSRSL